MQIIETIAWRDEGIECIVKEISHWNQLWNGEEWEECLDLHSIEWKS